MSAAGGIAVRALSGQLYECDYVEGWKVGDLRREVSEQRALPASQLELVLEGEVLGDWQDAAALVGRDLSLVVRRPVLAVTGAADASLRVWDLDAGACLATLKGHGDVVLSLTVDFDRRRALSGSADNLVCLWDLEACGLLGILKGHSDAVLALAADFRMGFGASGSIDGTLRLWDLVALECAAVLREDIDERSRGIISDTITALAVDFGRQRAASGMEDGRLVLWDLGSRAAVASLEGHRAGVTQLAADFGVARAVSSSLDRSVRLWDLDEATCLAVLEDHGRRVLDLMVDFGQAFAMSCSASSLCTWDLKSMTCSAKRKGNFADIEENPSVADFDSFDQKSVWDYEAELCDTVNRHACDITGVAANLHRHLAVSAHIDGSLRVLDLEAWRFLRTMQGHSGPIRTLCVDAFVEECELSP